MSDSKKASKVICPRSTDFEVHYASTSQIEKHGVCRKCRTTIKKAGKSLLAGKIELPVAIDQHHKTSFEQDGIAFEGTGEKVLTFQFDYDEVDKLLGEVKQSSHDALAEAAALFSKILQFCFSSERTRLKTAAARFSTIAASIRPDLLSDRTFSEIGAELNISKAAISKIATQFEDAFDFQLTRCRSPEARHSMREAQKKIWLTKRNRHRAAEAGGHGGGMPSQEVSLNGAA